ncbi:hypothetical protein FH972_024645 [Carpinus fangiana]|uniref:Cytochrome P450 n=1 Tax=Carpinus fangiana TaxID=176857 RepID=A0A5N6KZ44_9ROSI|nr:hypothetical protein FH972_024645 [Carpinus fangiana]
MLTYLTMELQLGIALSAVTLVLYTLYRWSIPRPFPGIPHNVRSAKSILGDLPAMMSHGRKSGEMWDWVVSQTQLLNSPIVQIFPMPFSKPWIILADARESQDILTKRIKDFDRSVHFKEAFGDVAPFNHINMPTGSPEFKANRKLIQDLMTPAFLHDIAAHRIHSVATSICDLWSEKARLANGRPFSVLDDVYRISLDVIWAVVLPFKADYSVINAQKQLLSALTKVDESAWQSIDDAMTFPEAEMPPLQNAIITLTDSIGKLISSPFPVLKDWYFRMLPHMRKAKAIKEDLFTKELQAAIANLTGDSEKQTEARCAMDVILRRELAAATKEGRKPNLDSRNIYDEVSQFHSTTILWGLKFFTNHQDIQTKLRDAVCAGFPTAKKEQRLPTADEITRAHIPYLEATREEILRRSITAPVLSRQAIRDTVVFGHHIPKGTDIFFLTNGPDFIAPPIATVPEHQRSESSQMAKSRTALWDSNDAHLFKPERWLVEKNGELTFDAGAGPMLTFGAGPRACFGRRLAYLELKFVFVFLVWNFTFKPIPQDLNGNAAVDKLTRFPKECYVRVAKN